MAWPSTNEQPKIGMTSPAPKPAGKIGVPGPLPGATTKLSHTYGDDFRLAGDMLSSAAHPYVAAFTGTPATSQPDGTMSYHDGGELDPNLNRRIDRTFGLGAYAAPAAPTAKAPAVAPVAPAVAPTPALLPDPSTTPPPSIGLPAPAPASAPSIGVPAPAPHLAPWAGQELQAKGADPSQFQMIGDQLAPAGMSKSDQTQIYLAQKNVLGQPGFTQPPKPSPAYLAAVANPQPQAQTPGVSGMIPAPGRPGLAPLVGQGEQLNALRQFTTGKFDEAMKANDPQQAAFHAGALAQLDKRGLAGYFGHYEEAAQNAARIEVAGAKANNLNYGKMSQPVNQAEKFMAGALPADSPPSLADFYENLKASGVQGWDDPTSPVYQQIRTQLQGAYGKNMPDQLYVPEDPSVVGNSLLHRIFRQSNPTNYDARIDTAYSPQAKHDRRAAAAQWFNAGNAPK